MCQVDKQERRIDVKEKKNKQWGQESEETMKIRVLQYFRT